MVKKIDFDKDNLNFEILDFLPFPVILITETNSFYWINHSAENFLQLSKSVLIGKQIKYLFSEENHFLSLISRVRKSHISLSEKSIKFLNPKFNEKFCSVQVVPINNINSFAFKADILITVQEESFIDKMIQNKQMYSSSVAMSKINSVLAHEIKNPLAGIKGAAQLLESDLPENKIELSKMIVLETDRIVHLLDRIEKFTIDGSLKLSKINIHEILDHCIKITKASFGRHIKINCDYDPSLPEVFADKELLIQCFINLFKNSSEATDENGEILITTSYSMTRFVPSVSSKKMIHLPLQIEIRDNGIGIKENLIPFVFEPFISGKINGSGLGLSMVANIISDHEGVIKLNSKPGNTCFIINLPIIKHNKNFKK